MILLREYLEEFEGVWPGNHLINLHPSCPIPHILHADYGPVIRRLRLGIALLAR